MAETSGTLTPTLAQVMAETEAGPKLHIRYEGQSFEYSLRQFDIGDQSTDTQIKEAVATSLEVPVSKLANYAVDKEPSTGNITLRPNASFG
jgi:hypothetical protein